MMATDIQQAIDREAQQYFELLVSERWTLEFAHKQLSEGAQTKPAALGGLNLFQVAGLAKAIALVQLA